MNPKVQASECLPRKCGYKKLPPDRLRFWVGLFLWISLLGIMACARRIPVPLTPLPPAVSREVILQALKDNSPQYSTLKSAVKVKIEYPVGPKVKKVSFDGALFFRDPGEFRLQGLGYLAGTLFDLLYKSNEMVFFVPSSALAYQGSPTQWTDFEDSNIFSTLGNLILKTNAGQDWDQLQFGADVYRPWTQDQGRTSSLEINQRTLMVDRKVILFQGKVAAEIIYERYEPLDGRPFPTQIKTIFPLQQVIMALQFEAPRLNEALSDTLFNLTLPPETYVVPLSRLRIDSLY